MADMASTIQYPIRTFDQDRAADSLDEIAIEYAYTIYVNDNELATVMCTPGALEELTVGFLASEGVIRSYDEIKQIVIDESNGIAYVDLTRPASLDPAIFSKRRISSCCGKSRQSYYFYNDEQTAKQSTSDLVVSPEQCYRLMELLHEESKIHHSTGGVHNAALCTTETCIVRHSDIGRHNALDKIYGHCLIQGIRTADTILVISGRMSSEMLLKAAKIGCGIVLSKSAPTDLALQLANELGISAAGFIRGRRMNVYTHPHRITPQ